MTGYVWQIPCLFNMDRELLPRVPVGSAVSCYVYNDMRLPVVFRTRDVYGGLLQHFEARYAAWEEY